jgi:hypothetical protein
MGAVQAYDSSFVKAKSRWERVILNDLPDVPAKLGIDWFSGVFGSGKAVNNSIDDVLIGYSVTDIDGIPSSGNNILGQAMPLYVRLTSKLSAPPISGMMIFDKADFDSMYLSDVELIIAHEMVRKELNIETIYSYHHTRVILLFHLYLFKKGHILGIGKHTLSWFCGALCRNFAFSTYQCPRAQYEYKQYVSSLNGTASANQSLQLSLPECGHWDESNFNSKSSSELMTPVFEKGKYQPLSRVTLTLTGYTVNFGAADPWKMGTNQRHRQASDHTEVMVGNRSEPIYGETQELGPFDADQPVAMESFILRHESLPSGDAVLTEFANSNSDSWIILEKI